jgi:hypothetical protein
MTCRTSPPCRTSQERPHAATAQASPASHPAGKASQPARRNTGSRSRNPIRHTEQAAGLALPLAFYQLGALRQDRLRAQVSKVGVWTGAPEQAGEEPGSWTVPVLVRNGSELPVRVDTVDLAVQARGYERVLAMPEGTTEVHYYMEKRLGESGKTYIAPGTIAPGDTWSMDCGYEPEVIFDQPQLPKASITRVVVTDAAGHQREMRTSKAAPARRVRRWRRWWWKRNGHL